MNTLKLNQMRASLIILILIGFLNTNQLIAQSLPVDIVTDYYNSVSSQQVVAMRSITIKPRPDGTAFVVPAGSTFKASIYVGDHYLPTGEPNMSFIKTEVMLTATLGTSMNDKALTYQYVDGLGRPIQTVAVKASPSLSDIVAYQAYDNIGREDKKYLSYSTPQADGLFKTSAAADQLQFYSPSHGEFNNKVKTDAAPFSKTIFEPSPLSRVLEQGAPGTVWQPDGTNSYGSSDRTIKQAYEFNVAGEVLLWTYTYPTVSYPFGLVNAGSAASPAYYAANKLYKNKTKDEQHNEVIEFTNKEGQTILKKVQSGPSQYANTYYIYDDFGNLVCVISPEAVKLITQTSPASEFFDKIDDDKNTFLKRWAFRYKYDIKKRMTHKQVPGADPIYMVYDEKDRLVMTQDGNQRTPKQWLYTKYDRLNRPIITGIYTHGGSENDQASMSTLISTSNFYETYDGNASTHGYTNTVFPTTGTVLTATYYDNYSFKSLTSGLGYVNDLSGQRPSEFLDIKGQVTGIKINVLGSSNYLFGVTYYDNKYRVIQTITQNHKSGTDRVTNKLDFTGKVTENMRTYVVSGVTRAVKETFTYDHAGRLLTVKHATNGAADVLLTKNEYNELGQLIDKKLHSTDNGTNFKQSIDYRFNIRGWLTKINESDISSIAGGETLDDYFGMELGYNNTISGITATAAFNGNISAMKWSTGGAGAANLQGNAYSYDALNRLFTTSHYKDAFTGWISDNSNLETGFNYDLNGNILALTRKGDASATIDNLIYTYNGNQLSYVNDSGDPAKGFVNGNTGTDDYYYDNNGNLIKDKNKGIANNNDIKYNYLNLTTEVIKGSDKVKYYYDATGRKLYQELYAGAVVTKTTDYVGEMIFESNASQTNALQFINTSEGRVLPDGANWEYQYHLKDHLGNVRVTFTSKLPTAVQHTASFETGTQTAEQTTFNNYSSIGYDLVDHTDAGTAYQKVQLLNGGASGRVGLAKSFAVMPGDKVKAEVYAKYRNLTATGNATSFITALAGAFGTSSGATGELGKLYTGLNNYASLVVGGDHLGDNEGAPKAFLTIILFDKNYNLVDAAWDQIDGSAEQVSGTVKSPPVHDFMQKEITVAEAGYAYVFLSNEHATFVDIYYDDVKFTHTPSPVVGVNDYYPFGLTINAYSRENSLVNQYLYNGKEKQDELDLGWLDYGARMYLSEIGRWGAVDPVAGKYFALSPYAYCANSPNIVTDPDGRDISFSYGFDNDGNLRDVTIRVTGKLINNSSRSLNEKQLERRRNRLEQGISNIEIEGGGINVKVVGDIGIANSESDLTSTDHAFRLVDDISKLPGVNTKNNPEGYAPLGANVVYLENDFTSQTFAHEIFHSGGLKHIDESTQADLEPTSIEYLQNTRRNGSDPLREIAGSVIVEMSRHLYDSHDFPGNLMHSGIMVDSNGNTVNNTNRGNKITRGQVDRVISNIKNGKINNGKQK